MGFNSGFKGLNPIIEFFQHISCNLYTLHGTPQGSRSPINIAAVLSLSFLYDWTWSDDGYWH